MSKVVVSDSGSYQLFLDEDLKALIDRAIAVEQEHLHSEEYSARRQELEHQLYDLYGEVGWSVVYEFKESPF